MAIALASTPTQESAFAFGPFRLLSDRRLLLEGDALIHLGSRALDILLVLVERRGELVAREELMARVWPATTVVEGNLYVHMNALRRALRDGPDGVRYIVNTAGRGYRFVAPVTIEVQQACGVQDPATRGDYAPPAALTQLVGRDRQVQELCEQLAQSRLVTLTGPGGVGKSAIALALATRMARDDPQRVRWVDLAQIADPARIAPAVAAAAAVVGERPILLVLDNGDHVVESVAALSMALLRDSPGLRILATSREPLSVGGEHVRRLSPLPIPAAAARPTAAEALRFHAVALFIQSASAAMGGYELTDADTPFVCEICRKLDGLPLAIELAAHRLEAFGARDVAARLGEGPRFLGARRGAPPRHRSMTAALDWSWALLTTAEQALLRRLAVFPTDVSLADIVSVAADPTCSESDVIETLMDLVAKSLVMAGVAEFEPRYRLLETTRAYALAKRPPEELGGRTHWPAKARGAPLARSTLPVNSPNLTVLNSKADPPTSRNWRTETAAA